MIIKRYKRENAVQYAQIWALKRNPKYFNFDSLGGDCTNFISQCIFSGAPQMNYTPITGWFYNSLNSRAPAWTGVNELYNFLINNKGLGPFGIKSEKEQVEIGDVIQLANANNTFFHTLIVSAIYNGELFVCSHTRNALNANLSIFNYHTIRYIKILGFRS